MMFITITITRLPSSTRSSLSLSLSPSSPHGPPSVGGAPCNTPYTKASGAAAAADTCLEIEYGQH